MWEMEQEKRVKGKMSVIFFEDGALETEFEGAVPLTKLNSAMFKLRKDYRLKYSVLKSVIHKQEMAREKENAEGKAEGLQEFKEKQEKKQEVNSKQENKDDSGRESEDNETVE